METRVPARARAGPSHLNRNWPNLLLCGIFQVPKWRKVAWICDRRCYDYLDDPLHLDRNAEDE
jgi:hypothetical protein